MTKYKNRLYKAAFTQSNRSHVLQNLERSKINGLYYTGKDGTKGLVNKNRKIVRKTKQPHNIVTQLPEVKCISKKA